MRARIVAAALVASFAVPAAAQELQAGLDNVIVRVSRLAPDAPVAEAEFETAVLTDTLWIDILMSAPGVDVSIETCSGFDLTNLLNANGGSIQTFTVPEGPPGPLLLDLAPGVHTRIEFPDPGDRACRQIAYALQPGVDEEIAAIATIHSDSPNRSALIALPRSPIVRQPVSITLAWYFGDAPLDNATVIAEVHEPDGRVTYVALRNDGSGADAEAGDALFSGSFVPRVPGLHVIKATGQTNSLQPSLTEGVTQVDVREAPLVISGPLGVQPVDENGNGFYEAVDVTFAVDAAELGTYEFSLVVSGEMGTNLVETLERGLASGQSSVTIRVPAARFRFLKEGPYVFGPLEAQQISDQGALPAGFLAEPAELSLTLADLQLPEVALYGISNDPNWKSSVADWPAPSILYRIDSATGAPTQLATLDSRFRFFWGGAAFLAGELYVSQIMDLEGARDPQTGQLGNCLATIDTASGEVTCLFDEPGPGSAFPWLGMAANESAGVLYVVQFGNPDTLIPSKLLAVRPTGEVTTINDALPIDPSGLAYDDTHGILYAIEGVTDSLYTLDTDTGEASLVGPLELREAGDPEGGGGLAYDDACGVLYATVGSSVFTVDVETGRVRLIHDSRLPNFSGLSWGAEGFDGLTSECTSPPPADLRLEIAPRVEVGLLGSLRAVEATISEVQEGSAAPRVDQPIQFEVVSGPNAGAGVEAASDAQGHAEFSYAGTGGVGVDEILVAVENDDGSPVSDVAIQFWDRDCNGNNTPDACEWDCLAFDRHCTAFPACGARGAADDGVMDACLVLDFCDVDGNGSIDRDDIDVIVAARNLVASGQDDSRDADGDGAITHLDARICTLRCGDAECARSSSSSGATPGSSCGLGFELALLLPVLRRLRSKRRRGDAAGGRT
jgi:hypothetical protein